MKLKEKMKRFWTLNVHNHEGFTLVELIIVIAILAILSSVAVVGYSSYVKKANMQADRTLVADVVNALTLYYYANSDKVTDGYVVLTFDKDCLFDDEGNGDAAMVAAFGEDWEKTLRLKYSGWMEDAQGGAGSAAATMDPAVLANAADMIADMANAATASNNTTVIAAVLSTFCTLTDEQEKELRQYEGEDNYSTIATNLMAKYISDELSNMQITTIEGNPVYTNANGEQLSAGAEMALTYAMLYSMANSDDAYSSQAGTVLDSWNKQLDQIVKAEQEDPSGTSVTTELMKLMQNLQGATVKDDQGNDILFGNVYVPYFITNGTAELTGIKSAMDAMSSITDGYTDAESLSNPDLMTGAAIVNAMKDFQTAVTNNGIVVRITNGVCQIVPELSK